MTVTPAGQAPTVVSVTLEVTPGSGKLRVPAAITRLLGLSLGDEVEVRLSHEGGVTEVTVRIGSHGELLGLGSVASLQSPTLLTLWAVPGREVEAVVERYSYASMTDSLYALARELDPAAKGIAVRALRDAAMARGLTAGQADPYRHIYTLLGYAKDRFVRSGKGTFRWQPVDDQAREGLGGKRLIQAAWAWAEANDPTNTGVHYQDLVAGLAESGTPVKGPDRGRTLYSNLIGSAGARAFERAGAGIFRRRVATAK